MHPLGTSSAVACVIISSLALVAGCGRSELSRAEIIARGDAACREADETVGPLFTELFPTGAETPPAARAAPIMTEASEAIRMEAEAFDSMRAAEDDETFNAIRDGVRDLADGIEASAQMARDGDTDGYLKALEQLNADDAELRERMKAYGFEACAGEE